MKGDIIEVGMIEVIKDPERHAGGTVSPGCILTLEEVARELRCSKAHVCNVIRGRVKNVSPLPAISMGRRKLVLRETLEQWKRENEQRGMMPPIARTSAGDADRRN